MKMRKMLPFVVFGAAQVVAACGGEDLEVSKSHFALDSYTVSLKMYARRNPCSVTECLYNNNNAAKMGSGCPVGWPRNSNYVWNITEHSNYWTIENGYTGKCLTYTGTSWWEIYIQETCDGGSDQDFVVPGLDAVPPQSETVIKPRLAQTRYVMPEQLLGCDYITNQTSGAYWLLY